LGFTLASNVAEVCLTDDAGWVTTVGVESVLNVSSEPKFTPPELAAEILKW
jgi:hypothetical protein